MKTVTVHLHPIAANQGVFQIYDETGVHCGTLAGIAWRCNCLGRYTVRERNDQDQTFGKRIRNFPNQQALMAWITEQCNTKPTQPDEPIHWSHATATGMYDAW